MRTVVRENFWTVFLNLFCVNLSCASPLCSYFLFIKDAKINKGQILHWTFFNCHSEIWLMVYACIMANLKIFIIMGILFHLSANKVPVNVNNLKGAIQRIYPIRMLGTHSLCNSHVFEKASKPYIASPVTCFFLQWLLLWALSTSKRILFLFYLI